MKAVVATAYRPVDQLTVREMPIPRPGPGQLQVRVTAASINPADVLLPRGDVRAMIELDFPHIPGNDFAGQITEVGLGTNGYAVGDEVFGVALPRVMRSMAPPTRPSLGTGSLAEYVVVEADTPLVAHRPAGLTAVDAAALATTGFTAVAVAAVADLRPGQTALVVGASGGAGTAVVPLLAEAGARVIATTTPAEAELLQKLGAAETVDYRAVDTVEEVLRRHPAGVDLVVNAVPSLKSLAGLASTLIPGGLLISITGPVPDSAALGRADVRTQFVLDMEGVHGGMAKVAELAAAGRLPATISRRYPLDQAVQALTDFAGTHKTGKLVVVMD
ncbi:NADP-dependent oxidoreductase [Hamadaea sp. NPDC051192]|uniref:NADP-dependent oxidoreductase n=1 Tax=Hamadaea sp. NPDC051192 TaxID=3154940 RepID=UPI00341B9694